MLCTSSYPLGLLFELRVGCCVALVPLLGLVVVLLVVDGDDGELLGTE